MTNEEFRAWISGYLTLSEEKTLNTQQLDIIKNHANLVLTIEKKLDSDVIAFLEKIEKDPNLQNYFGKIFNGINKKTDHS